MTEAREELIHLIDGLPEGKVSTLLATARAEIAYTIQKQGGVAQELLVLRSIADGDLALVELVPEDMTRVIELVDTYDDFPLGTTDASVIAMAERLSVNEIAPLDRRHFPNVRPRHAEYLTSLPRGHHGRRMSYRLKAITKAPIRPGLAPGG